MSVAASPSDARLSPAALPRDRVAAHALSSIRQTGGTMLRFVRRGDTTTAADVSEWGGHRVRLPRGEHGCEAALVNTGGGIVGGDTIAHDIGLAAGAVALVTTPSAERVYRTLGPPATSTIRLAVAASARLTWMPQEIILFQGASLTRTIEADVAADGSLLVLEMTVLGRLGMGEHLTAAQLRDDWRIRRAGRLVFADAVRLDGDATARMLRPAIGGGARVIASLLYVGSDADDCLAAVRADLDTGSGSREQRVEAGASAWNGVLSLRLLSNSIAATRATLAPTVARLARRPMPRLWWT